jgi:hypothetical protein
MGSMVIVIVLPLTKLVVEQVYIVSNAVFVQELIKLLFIDARFPVPAIRSRNFTSSCRRCPGCGFSYRFQARPMGLRFWLAGRQFIP